MSTEARSRGTGAAGFAIGEPGRAASEVGPGAPTRFPDSADYELSDSRVPGAHIRAVSLRGLIHRYRHQPRQDRFAVVYDAPTSTLVVAVCDGVGQFALSQEAASFVAADVTRAFLTHRDWQIAVDEVNQRLKGFIENTASRPHLDPIPEDARMATTLAAAAICVDPHNRKATVAWTDDSSIWFLEQGDWRNLTPDPDTSEATSGLHTGRVKALPHTNPRLLTSEESLGPGALFVMTDGIGTPLQGSEQVRDTLATWWATPPEIFTFAQQAGFARKGHMDDRTVVGVWFDQSPHAPQARTN